ncbi:MAG: rod shape-determining protein RodA [Deltaproteobacteria bacterium]|nr:rod shape-determining protein RodA [Deltaproteobacteria bacterium]
MQGIDRRLIQNFEWPLFTMALLVAGIGIVNLVSASPDQTASGLPGTALRQLAWLGIGVVLMLATLVPDYRTLERFAFPFYVLVVALLVGVFFGGRVVNGSRRWLDLGPLNLQPSELAKLAMILVFARILARRSSASPVGLRDLIVPAVLIAIPAALIVKQPDLGTTLVVCIVSASFLVLTRVRVFSFVLLAAIGVVGATVGWFYFLHDYQKERVFTFLDPERDPLGTAYHAIQSQIAVGSGGLFGKGFGLGSQSQLDFLPEQQTDFVFSVLGEEWGFVGSAVVLALYLGILIRGLMIAHSSKDSFGSYLAVGIVALFFWAGLINVGMVIGVVPVVGVPLPMLSYGGSALLTCMIAIGLLMNVSMRRYVF